VTCHRYAGLVVLISALFVCGQHLGPHLGCQLAGLGWQGTAGHSKEGYGAVRMAATAAETTRSLQATRTASSRWLAGSNSCLLCAPACQMPTALRSGVRMGPVDDCSRRGPVSLAILHFLCNSRVALRVRQTDCSFPTSFSILISALCLAICFLQASQIRQIRKKMMDIMTREASTGDLKDLVAKLIPESIAKDITKACQGACLCDMACVAGQQLLLAADMCLN
jgi:hypothetical protein